ncbi:ABC transporter ATP-binding protein [Geotoga petraea]|uniref:ABC-2 type transport system ATP-binding protein n=1 Tax=Geotoga petraea TaxID=28234 RepID=A0A1G6KVC1_9BACT|nr:ABC transporter ATP-binding protein [Geotoga petraea]SDC34768.1 ABC-2 type transport system ATP-binding protein [Geotoga petraea]
MIKVEHIKKYYGKYLGVEDISFKIKKGEIYGLIGPNGAGKTTTIRAMMGMISIDKGEITIGGKKIPHDLKKIKNQIGYLPGEVNFYETMKVKDFFDFNDRFYKNIDKEYENELIKLLELETNKKFKELSMGNKKKVGIIQAIIHKPDYIIFDEPTNGLDPLLQQKLYGILKREKERGATILFSSHILSEVEKICDRVGIVKKGKIIKENTIDELSKMYKKAISIYKLDDKNKFKDFEIKEETDSFITYFVKNQNLNKFFDILSSCTYEDIEIKRPSLEEIFIDYYRSDEE